MNDELAKFQPLPLAGTSALEQRSFGRPVSQLLLTVFWGPAGRIHGCECAVYPGGQAMSMRAGDGACGRGASCERVSAAAAIARMCAMGCAGFLVAARSPQCGGAAARPWACRVRAGLASAERRRAPQTDQRMTNESVTRRYE